MRVGRTIAGVFLLLGVLVISAFSYVLWSREVTLYGHNQGIVIKRFDCYTSLMRDKDENETWLNRENTCSDDGALWEHLASDKALTRKLFEGINRIYLGHTHFAEGPFLFCDLLDRLSDDSRWTDDIDSPHAGIMLQRMLPRAKLVPSAHETFVNAGKSIKSVELEMVLINDEAAGLRCPKVPEKIPTHALVHILFEP